MYLESLLELLPGDLSAGERSLIERAYRFAEAAHAPQTRRSGEPYIVHCMAVAKILANLQLDTATIAAALLHDTIEDTPVTLYELEETFGKEVARLVDGVSKLDSVPRVKDGKRVTEKIKPGNEEEFLRKTILAMDQDVRVILIKLADRLHNLRTLDSLPARRQRAIAQETMEIFAPLAYRLGIWTLKCELEDLSFPHIHPEEYQTFKANLEKYREASEPKLLAAAERLQSELAAHNIEAEVCLGDVRFYDLHTRMKEKNLPLSQIHNLRPIRVLVNTLLDCYAALGVAHELWRPVEKGFHDYIALPKDNHYQSLHTVVIIDDSGFFLNLQMRTLEMHQHAQYGVVSRWLFRNGAQSDEMFERSVRYLHSLLEVGSGVENAVEYIDTIRADVLQDRIYVITPQGHVKDLPKGATPVDFAYHIHTDVGHRCRGAKVDDKMVPLDYVLRGGDTVEIITAGRGGPSIDWLNPELGLVKTRRALARIRQWFRRQDHAGMTALGRKVITRELRRLGLNWMTHENVADIFNLTLDDLLVGVGSGDIDGFAIAKKVLERENGWWLNLVGADGLIVHLAVCCNPSHGQAIKGYQINQREAVIHQARCPEIAHLDACDALDVRWRRPNDERYPVPITITAHDREGLMRDISTIVTAEGVNMAVLTMETHNNIATFHGTMEITSVDQLIRMLTKIEFLPNVREAHRRTVQYHHNGNDKETR
ncbi:MAG: bifunctional (p)ppGpp synthetase/guanosine-3',5'-bis(diphosphate) 3'-pyrophosphohydrolase [Anaerolineae bacterium]|nr:bifunctional (p)ppGpp synthetase/guanosine-3',5'-bis(diphosphate) 3'-pyrophosphohydrolase [Anaerolineae bacterium]